jgi:6-phosphofructokinase 1
VGREAVRYAIAGKNAVMAGIRRTSQKPYRWSIEAMPLAKVANKEKMMPRNFITRDGFHITSACRDYLSPLIAGEAPQPYRNGLPVHARLKNLAVPKKLALSFTIK